MVGREKGNCECCSQWETQKRNPRGHQNCGLEGGGGGGDVEDGVETKDEAKLHPEALESSRSLMSRELLACKGNVC